MLRMFLTFRERMNGHTFRIGELGNVLTTAWKQSSAAPRRLLVLSRITAEHAAHRRGVSHLSVLSLTAVPTGSGNGQQAMTRARRC